MSKRMWMVITLAGGVAALSGCVVVPTEPAYGYGHGYGAPRPVVRVAPPPVVVVPPPRHRHYSPHYPRYPRYGERHWR